MTLALPIASAVFVWWFTTGVLIVLARQPKRRAPHVMATATVIGLFGLAGLWFTARETGTAAIYGAFGSAIAVWGWQELAFLTGQITGPRRAPPREGTHGWARFRDAAATLIHHEIALAATAAIIVALCWGAPNPTGIATFAVLWLARLSAKLNLHFGVPRLATEFLPPALEFLRGYLLPRPPSLLLPASILAGTAGAIALLLQAGTSAGSNQAGFALVGTLLTLAVLEHAFMILPIPDAALWRWAAKRPVTILQT